ncbi:MAG: hypothetical protein H6539_08555 [Bacteroidales bacterium]|nr:hypothetical protein [Bacteroidales bacterium]
MKALGKSGSISIIIMLVSLLVGMTSCFDSNYDLNNISDEMEITPGLSIPLAFGTLNLEDIMQEIDTGDFVKKFDEDSLLYIVYSENLESYKARDFISIPDQNFLQFFIDSDVATAGLISVPVGDTATSTKEKNGEFVFDNGEKIDSMNLESLVMHIDVTSSFHHKGILIIYSDSIFVDGEKFRKEIQISSTAGNFSYNLDTTLTNVKLIFDNSDNDTTFLPLKYDLDLINSGAVVLPGESCEINMAFRNNLFSSMFGYLGEYNLLVNTGQIDVSIFNEKIQGGTLHFADPRLAITVNNSYGIPVQIELSNVAAVSAINGTTVPITFNGVNPFDIAAPDIAHFGESLYSEVPINKDNSNILEAVESSPNHLNYTATAKTNAMGPSGPYNYITDSSIMDMGFQVILPLWLKAEGFSLEDSLDFDFEEQFGNDLDMIEYFRLTLDAENGIPMETNLQVYFYDTGYTTLLDSLFKDDTVLLDPATVGSDEKVIAPKHMLKQVEFTKAELDAIKTAKFALVKATVNTSTAGTGFVKFYSYYGIDFKLSAKANFRINSNKL